MSVCLNLSTTRSKNPIGGGEGGMYEADKQRRNYNEWFCNFHLKCLLTENLQAILPISCNSATRRSWGPSGGLLWLLGGSRTRGFPSPPLGGFGFVVIDCASFIRRAGEKILIVNLIRPFSALRNVRFGSLADYWTNSNSMSASGVKRTFQVGQFCEN